MKRILTPPVSYSVSPLHFSFTSWMYLFKTCHFPYYNPVSSCHIKIVNHSHNAFCVCLGSFGFIQQNFKPKWLRQKLSHTCPSKQIPGAQVFLFSFTWPLLSFLMVSFSNTFSLLVAIWQLKTMSFYFWSLNP